MRFGCIICVLALLPGGRWAAAQELKIWRVASPADPATRGPAEAGPLEAGAGRASYHLQLTIPDGAREAALYMEPDARVTAGQAAGSLRLDVQAGAAVVHYTARGGDAAPLVIVAGDAWLRLQPGGMVRVERTADAVRFLLARGRADRFAGTPPADAPAAAQGGEALAADPAVYERARILIAGLTAAGTSGFALDWISRAERGDLAPTERFARPSMEAYLVRTTGVVTPRTATVTTPPQFAATPAVTAGLSQAQALLASQNPASVVVGARLERTRIVGNPGTSGAGIRFNAQARPPLQLGTPLR